MAFHMISSRRKSGPAPLGSGGGGGGGGNADLSWTGSVSGADKGAQAGFIAPVKFSDGTKSWGSRVFPISATGTVDFYVERVLGETGSISVTYTTFASVNVTASTHYTTTTGTVSFADGEIGWKKISVPILAIPTGFGIVGIDLGTGTDKGWRYSYIWLQGTGYVSGAKFLSSLGAGTDSSGNTAGSGTSGSPWLSPSFAATQMGNTGGVLYVRDNASYKELKSGLDHLGAFKFANACSVTAPLIVLPDPANSGTVLFDNGDTFPTADNDSGIIYNSGASHIWLVGMRVTHGNINFQDATGTRPLHCVLWKMEADNYKISGSNGAGFRVDNTDSLIVNDCNSHEIYSTEGSHTSNSYTAVASGFHECYQFFNACSIGFYNCRADKGEFGIFMKSPNTAAARGPDISHCRFERFQRGSTQSGSPIAFEVAGGGSPAFNNAVVRYNVHNGNLEDNLPNGGTGKSAEMVYINPDGGFQSTLCDIFNNVNRKNEGQVASGNCDHLRVFNNIIEDVSNGNVRMTGSQSGINSVLETCDYNLYVRGQDKWLTATTYSSFASWKAISGDARVTNAPDSHSTTTSTTPSYTDATNWDYRLHGPTGRGVRYIGVGDELVGKQNP